ncbi:hypothetical protein HZH68_003918 [Vespula germanica]|uniref:Uncharacterized protein n=1 Tax=Vespula germanica TaxID=30212 RepID=A0A834KMW8_VESGE|nr:hypothetical protein HZH68_003918 [Vespula germanica]
MRPFQRPRARALGAIVSEKKSVKGKLFFPLFYISRYISAPIAQLWRTKICAYRAQRDPSNDPGPVPVDTEEKIWAYREQRVLSRGPGPVPLKAIISEKEIVKEKFFLPWFCINRNIFAPDGQIWMKEIWAYRAQRDLSNGPRPVPLGAIVSEKKIVKEFFFSFVLYKPLYLGSYWPDLDEKNMGV